MSFLQEDRISYRAPLAHPREKPETVSNLWSGFAELFSLQITRALSRDSFEVRQSADNHTETHTGEKRSYLLVLSHTVQIELRSYAAFVIPHDGFRISLSVLCRERL